MAIQEIELELNEEAVQPYAEWLVAARDRINLYWDQFPQKPLPQYIECDFDLVSIALQECVTRGLIDGKLFVEWGCGFGVVAGVAGQLGLDAIGIEAEPFLCEEARKLLAANSVSAEIWQGNFLPRGARGLAEDEDPLVSLTHHCVPAYEEYGIELEDFAIVFAYPWPGEEHFIKSVFNRYARSGALLLAFRGPNQIELYRKK